MKSITLVFIIFVCIPLSISAQVLDDYRTISSGAWSSFTIWERYNGTMWVAAGAAPTSASQGIFIRNAHHVFANTVLNADQVIVEPGGTLTITSNFTLADGPGDDILVNGTMNFNSGTLTGAGSIVISNTGMFFFTTADVKTTDGGVTITNQGTITWQEGGLNASGPVVNNNIFNIQASALWQFTGGLTNTGTINKTAGTTTINTPWSNSGTINLSGGTLTSSSAFTNTGTVSFTSGAVWQNNSTFNHNAGSSITGTGSFINNATLALAVDQVFPATLVFTSSAGNIISGPGSLTINNDFVIQNSVTGGPLIVNGNVEWTGGTLGRTLTIAAGRTFLWSTSNVKTFDMGSTITNNGTMTWQEGGLNFSGNVVNNNIFNIQASALWQFNGGLANTGTINKTAGNTTIQTPWSNSGTINLSGGSLINSGVFTNTGPIIFSGAATWQNNSTFNHNVGSSVTGTGSFNNNGTFALAIDQVFPATLVFTSAAANTISGPGSLTINNDFVIQNSVTGGPLMVNGNVEWTGGILGRTMTIDAGRTFLWSTSNVKTFDMGSTITNNGTMTWQEGGLNFSGNVVNNNIFNIQASALWQFNGGLTNTGTINKTAGTTNISTPWNNSGTINLSGGTLTNSAVFTNTGTVLFTSGAVWQNNSTFNHNAGSSISGTGSFINNATLALAVDQVFPATLVFTSSGGNIISGPGSLTINNDFVIQNSVTGGPLIVNGNVEWTGGILGRTMTIDAVRTFLWSTSNVKTFDIGSTITNNGTMTWQEGGLNFSGNVVNNNIFNIQVSALWQFNGGMTNNGIITKSNAGTTNLSTPVTNSASGVISGIGTFTLSSSFTNNGVIMPGVGIGILAMNGVQPLTAGGTLEIEIMDDSGPGTGHDLLTRSGNLMLTGALTVTETGIVPNGLYTIIELSSGTLSGNFTTLNLPPGYTVQINSTTVVVSKQAPLALHLISFIARKSSRHVVLQWATTDEQHVSHFEIQRSTNGDYFQTLAKIDAFNIPAGATYEYIDVFPSTGANHYRLRIIDRDGAFTFSPVQRVAFSEWPSMAVYPTVTHSVVNVDTDELSDVFIYSPGGTLLGKTQAQGRCAIDLSPYPAGVYTIRIGQIANLYKVLKLD